MFIARTQLLIALLSALQRPAQPAFNAILLDSWSGSQLYTPLSHGDQVANVDFGLPHTLGSAVVTMNNIVYIMGGVDNDGTKYSRATTSLNPATNITTRLADMNLNRIYFAAAALPREGAIIVCGHGRLYGPDYKTCERYNVYLNEWTFIQSLPLPCFDTGRYYNNAAITLRDSVFMIGGKVGNTTYDHVLNTVFKLQPDGQWTELGNMPTKLDGSSLVAVGETSAMLCGGYNGSDRIASCYIYSAPADQWTKGLSLTQPRAWHTLIQYNGRLWCLGGDDINERPLQTVEVYDEFTGWQELPLNIQLYDGYGDGVKSIAAISA